MGIEEDIVKKIIRSYGKLYSEELGIKLKVRKETETFKWFLASKLFARRINAASAW